MRILVYSPLFYPSIGGLESIIESLAYEFSGQGHEVKVISTLIDKDLKNFPFEVVRQPSFPKVLSLVDWCDIFFHGCISLKGIWPLLSKPRPLIATHQTWYRRPSGNVSWQDGLKLWLTRFSTNISASQAIANHLPAPSHIVPNAYRSDLFRELPNASRNKDLVFLGRLVSDKGVSLLLDALSQLRHLGHAPTLTIIGQGPEELNLCQQVQTLALTNQVTFTGPKLGAELVEQLNTHRIMVIPSLWDEPFGIVALEGIACGCVVVASSGGGLKDAVGPCGITFPNGNVQALTETLVHLLNHPERLASYTAPATAHLARHHPATVAKAYLEIFETALK
ncbi:MAG: glycosyltransferase family 4 protein [Cyanobacteria bacterium J06581_3]